jgi:hypothetical protein
MGFWNEIMGKKKELEDDMPIRGGPAPIVETFQVKPDLNGRAKEWYSKRSKQLFAMRYRVALNDELHRVTKQKGSSLMPGEREDIGERIRLKVAKECEKQARAEAEDKVLRGEL